MEYFEHLKTFPLFNSYFFLTCVKEFWVSFMHAWAHTFSTQYRSEILSDKHIFPVERKKKSSKAFLSGFIYVKIFWQEKIRIFALHNNSSSTWGNFESIWRIFQFLLSDNMSGRKKKGEKNVAWIKFYVPPFAYITHSSVSSDGWEFF